MKLVHKWPEGWEAAAPSARKNMEAQVRRELGVRHPLAALSPRYIGRYGGGDDFVFSVDHWMAPYFVVHLTWSDGSSAVPDCAPIAQISDLMKYEV